MTIIEPTTYDGDALRERRVALGLSLTDVRDYLRDRIPHHEVPSTSKLSRLERNMAPYADVAHLIYALCALYDMRVSQVSETAANELERWSDLLTSLSPWIPTRCDGQLSLMDAETAAIADEVAALDPLAA